MEEKGLTTEQIYNADETGLFLESFVGQSSFEDESSNEEEEEESQDEKIVSNSEAVECFKKCLSWMERQSNVDAIQIMQLRRMMELSVHTRSFTLKQMDLP